MGVKVCSRCRLQLPLDSFIFDNRRKDGRGSWCRDCHKLCPSLRKRERSSHFCLVCASTIDAGRADKQYCSDECGKLFRQRRYSLKRYGVTPDDYYEMLRVQGGLCAICRKPETASNKIMSLDHCHTSGAVRGLLCHRCNSALGLFLDDVELLRNAISYLEAHNARVG